MLKRNYGGDFRTRADFAPDRNQSADGNGAFTHSTHAVTAAVGFDPRDAHIQTAPVVTHAQFDVARGVSKFSIAETQHAAARPNPQQARAVTIECVSQIMRQTFGSRVSVTSAQGNCSANRAQSATF